MKAIFQIIKIHIQTTAIFAFCFFVMNLSLAAPVAYQVVVQTTEPGEFNLEQDILNPSDVDRIGAEIQKAILQSIGKSLLPIFINANTNKGLVQSVSGNASKDQDNQKSISMNDQILMIASNLSSEFSQGLIQQLQVQNRLPWVTSVALVPQDSFGDNSFYGASKIAMPNGTFTNALAINPFNKVFESKFTDLVRASIINTNSEATSGVNLISLVSRLNIDVKNSNLEIMALLAIDPTTQPFTEANEEVEFTTMSVKSISNDPTVALVKINIDLSESKQNPQMKISFGRFDKYLNGEFIIKNDNRINSALVLSGNLKKYSLDKYVAINVVFTEIVFDLVNLKIQNLQTLTQPGLKIGRSLFIPTGFSVSTVNQKFMDEINKKIADETNSAKTKATQFFDSGLITQKVLESIMTRVLK